ncbi:DUF2642 domain-containing protein [Fictibacillus aquaticus]|uniref:DUF2642 domain-containing protein n=1 Tax=Fictibacillus aquaticus TaxID=2021314 RepID=A0A235F532_9BACL|nr:hypothetical protein [Fictibacillus aquaticus]OYD56370.1 hypothetical protein CGZ90_17605 [Fictibacillus aquaticus]
MFQMKHLLKKHIILKMTGGKVLEGILADVGNDILVLLSSDQYYYIPLLHIHKIRVNSSKSEAFSTSGPLISSAEKEKAISYRSILTQAKGLLTQIHVSGKQDLRGYITHVMSDYFVFYSPIYKTIYIPLFHLKWLTLCNEDNIPLTLEEAAAPAPLSRSWEEQLKKFEGRLVVFDLGTDSDKVGMLKKIDGSAVELVTTKGETLYHKLNHLKSVYVP